MRRPPTVHYYNYVQDGWNPETYPHPRFASEYGFQSYPAMAAWQRTADADDTDLLALMDHRQHFPYGDVPVLLQIRRHLPLPARSHPDYAAALAYMSQISQAMVTRTETEVYRAVGRADGATRTAGALYWQLNDVWVAPSWSSIEYGGTFKVLHHWAAEFFAPVAVVAHLQRSTGTVAVYVVRDTLDTDDDPYTVDVQLFVWSTMQPLPAGRGHRIAVRPPPNAALRVASIPMRELFVVPLTVDNSFVRVRLLDATNRTVSVAHVFAGTLKNAVGLRSDVQVRVTLVGHECRDGRSTVDVRLAVDHPALFVFVTVRHAAVRAYRLSANGFVQLEPVRTVRLSFANAQCAVELRASDVRVQTVNEYMGGGS